MTTPIIVLFLTLFAFGVSSLPSKRFHHICPPNGEIVAPHPTFCSKYILCADGFGEERDCRNGTIFNYETGICSDRDETSCDLCRFNTKPVHLLPFEGNCSKFIVCYGTSRVERECSAGLYFDSVQRMCDERENAVCEHDSVDGDAATIECRDNVDLELVPSLESCEKYFICTKGTPTAHNCSDGLIYNIVKKGCTTTGRCLHDYSPTCETSGAMVPHLFECRHFFYCDPDEVEPMLQACKLGQLFDRSKSRCVPENETVCPEPPEEELENWPSQGHLN